MRCRQCNRYTTKFRNIDTKHKYMKPDFTKIPKPTVYYFFELLKSIYIIEDAVNLVKKGKLYFDAVVDGQLRSLLCDRNKNSKALLFFLAEKINFNIDIFSSVIYEDKNLNKDCLYGFYPGIISVEKKESIQEKINFAKYLSLKKFIFKGYGISSCELIELMSNNYGGSHYSRKIEKINAELLQLFSQKKSQIDTHLTDVKDMTVSLSKQIIVNNSTSELSFSFELLSHNIVQEEIIFHSICQYSNNEIKLLINKEANLLFFVKLFSSSHETNLGKLNTDVINNIFIQISNNEQFKGTINVFLNNKKTHLLCNEAFFNYNAEDIRKSCFNGYFTGVEVLANNLNTLIGNFRIWNRFLSNNEHEMQIEHVKREANRHILSKGQAIVIANGQISQIKNNNQI